jgi:hypothetical protein
LTSRKKKNPVAGAKVKVKKRPKRAPLGDPLASEPTTTFGLSLVDLGGPWGWSRIEVGVLDRVLKFMHGLESMRPTEIFGRRSKFIPLDAICPDAYKRLETLKLDDRDGLWELRVSGLERIWGDRQQHVFYPVWWDPLHEVCPATKKHT